MIILITLVLVLLAAFGAPLFSLILAIGFLGLHANDAELSVVALEFYRLADMPVLIAIPLFTIAGYVIAESKAPQRLVALTEALFGWMRGGLVLVALVACALFTAFTGASGVTIIAIGALLYPALRQSGYQKNFSLGLVTVSGSLGLLFAPSLPLILYGIVAQQLTTDPPVVIDDLFLAGIFPGLLMMALLFCYGYWKSPPKKPDVKPFELKAALKALKAAGWELPLPIVVLGGIYSGVFAASEIAAVTALYVLIVETLIHREVSPAKLFSAIREAMAMVGAILVILGASLVLTYYLIDEGVPERIFGWINQHVHDRFTFLLWLNLFLLVLGMLLDIFSAIVLMTPIILPLALQFGIHPVHLGIIFLANMELGYFTPPVGMNLFISSYRFREPMSDLVRHCVPFFFILLLAVMLITYVPLLSLGLIGH